MATLTFEPMTTDEFFAHVQAEGFNGYAPGKGDVLGDKWAACIAKLFDRTVEVAGLPPSNFRHRVWLVWQWLYCMLAKCESRIIASPPACRLAGVEISPDVVSAACRLLILSCEID